MTETDPLMPFDSRFIIGIDLGTTNTAVSYIDTETDELRPRQFPIPQLVSAGELAALDLLPSFCYLPGEHELPPGALELPWERRTEHPVGTFAREQGAAVPGRAIASAKSWLAHGGVDRTSPILPWGGDVGDQAVSPVTVSRYYLEHIRHAWDHRFGGQKDASGTACIFSEQTVVLTVPASFDEAARELTAQAAREAGIENLVLLEEPLAAFYAWLLRHESDWSETLCEGETVLVVDIGGGTTDLSLVSMESGKTLRRTAVGDHLLLGGDNVDMALAREAEASWNTKLGAREWSMLCQECRRAKERILAPDGPTEIKVTVTGVGSSVVAGTRSCVLTRSRLVEILLDGFFPAIGRTSAPPSRRAGIREMGLPFVADPAVTRHLLAFLRQGAGHAAADTGCDPVVPDRILFNGGSLLPEILRQRLADVIASWGGRTVPVPELDACDLNLAVCRGAAYYGLVRRGSGVRVKGGIARSYYLEVHAGDGTELVCVMPRDTEEGKLVEVPGRTFHAHANQPVRFPIYASATRLGDCVGDVLADREEITPLPPLQTVLSYGKGGIRELEVTLASELNEVGTLDLWCATTEGHHRYPLRFDLRATVGDGDELDPEILLPAETLDAAVAAVREVFADSARLPSVAKTVEAIVELKRREWGLTLLRRIADVLLADSDLRTRSPEHEARWLNFLGFCARPGFGTPGDDWRAREMWKLWHGGPNAARKPQVVAEWWILWRRVAGGLRPGHEEKIGGELMAELLPKGSNKLGPRNSASQEAVEMWRCFGALERTPVKAKARAIRQMLSSPQRLQDHHYWVLARLGARRLFHGPANAVIPASRLHPLLPLLFESVTQPTRQRMALFAISCLCRMCGIRDLDVAPKYRDRAAELLEDGNAPDEWRAQLCEVRTDSREYQAEVMGDALPLGLTTTDGWEEGIPTDSKGPRNSN